MHDSAWAYVQALVEQDVTNGKELLEMQGYLLEKNHFRLTHVVIIRAAIGTDEVRTDFFSSFDGGSRVRSRARRGFYLCALCSKC